MAKQGFGAFFQLSTSAIADNTTGLVGELTSVGLPNPSTGTTETTNHASAGGVREYLPDLVDIGEFKVGLNLVPGSTSDTACAAAATSRALYNFKCTVPAASGTWTYSGSGIVTGYAKDDVAVGGVMKATLSIKPTGAVTRAAGS